MQEQIEMEELIRENNRKAEMQINLDSLKGGIPQAHKWQHKNSIKSFKELRPGPRHCSILNLLFKEYRPMTDRQIKKSLGFDDLNSVRPRISELIDFNYIKQLNDVIDQDSKELVREVFITQKGINFIRG